VSKDVCIESREGFVEVRIGPEATVEDYAYAFRAVADSFDDALPRLWILPTRTELPRAETQRLARASWDAWRSVARVAVVTGEDLVFGLSRQHLARTGAGDRVGVFRDRPAAVAWLSS